MPQINKSTLHFLSGLKKNNNRDWFNENRKSYEEARGNFETYIQSVINEITLFEPVLKGLEAKSCIFRINRDTRFSNDKSVYKTNFGGFIVRGGKKNGGMFPGYYLHVEPGGCFIAGGAYIPPAPWLNAIRDRIDAEGEKLVRLSGEKEFVRYFGGLQGEKLKTAPRGYPKDHPQVELLKHKSFLAEMTIKDSEIITPECFDMIIKAFRVMKPLNDFLSV